MTSFVGGRLRLKAHHGGVLTKKRKKKAKRAAAPAAEGGAPTHDAAPDSVPPHTDTRTATERRFDETRREREGEEIRRAAEKTHRQKVQEFNEKLAVLSEHHDIPKVGPG